METIPSATQESETLFSPNAAAEAAWAIDWEARECWRRALARSDLTLQLQLAARAGDVQAVVRALTAGAEVDEPYGLGLRALHMAARGGHPHIISLLLRCGAAVNRTDFLGRTALHEAAANDHVTCVTLLVRAGAVVDRPDGARGHTPLHLAALHGCGAAVQLLLACGAEPARADAQGHTVLHLARSEPLRRLLLKDQARQAQRAQQLQQAQQVRQAEQAQLAMLARQARQAQEAQLAQQAQQVQQAQQALSGPRAITAPQTQVRNIQVSLKPQQDLRAEHIQHASLAVHAHVQLARTAPYMRHPYGVQLAQRAIVARAAGELQVGDGDQRRITY